jgi:hypothetical protein
MANDLSFNQLSTVLTAITNQATGVTNPAPVNTGSFVNIAQMALKTGYDPLTTAISQVLSRTIFSVRPYSRKFKGLNVSNQRYGNHVRKLLTIDKPFEDDDRFKLVDGESIDQYKVNKPKVLQTNFYGAKIYQKSLTIFKDQLDCAFNSPDEFASFISMIMQNASDMIEQAHEETARATIANLVAGIYRTETGGTSSADLAKSNGGRRAVNLLALYNIQNGTSLKVNDIFKTANFEGFVKFAFATINTIADLMTDRNTLFSSQLTDYTVIRHTPKSKMKFYLYTDLVNKINSEVYSSIFNPDFLKAVDFESVNFWQSPLNPSLINNTPSILKKDGTVIIAGTQVNMLNVIGVLFDEEAAGYTTVNEWAQPSPFNARGGYYNQFWHFTDRYWNDFTENAVIFYIEDINTTSAPPISDIVTKNVNASLETKK